MIKRNTVLTTIVLAAISTIGISGCAAQQTQKTEKNAVKSVQTEQKGNNSNAIPQTDNKTQAAQYYLEGIKYYGNNEYQKAKDSWTKAQQLDPKNEDVNIALKRIDQLLSQKGQNLQQEKPAAKTAADAKAQASQYYLEGVKYYGNREYGKAKEAWRKAHQLDPKNEDVNIALKRIDQLLSQKGQNLQQEKPAAKNAADNKIQASQYYLEGLKYFGNAEYEKAKNVWTKAHQLDPYNEDVVNGLKRVEHLLGK